jgi:hypothetical protein
MTRQSDPQSQEVAFDTPERPQLLAAPVTRWSSFGKRQDACPDPPLIAWAQRLILAPCGGA